MKKRKEKREVRLVAWGSWKEWDCVRAAFFSSCPSRISAAIDRIAVWQARTRIPISVEITSNLLSIHQRDPSMREDIPEGLILPDEMLRLMYAMSIMRLINGVVDDKKNFAFGSVASRASQAELPHLLVSIRHDSAHGQIPSICVLRIASIQALEWLKIFYWDRQKRTLQNARSKLKALLIDYVAMLQETYVPNEDLSGQDKRQLKRVRHDRELHLHKLIKRSQDVPQELVSILLDDSLLETQEANTCESNEDKLTSIQDLSWKFTISKLSSAIPELLPMLALGIVRRLSGLEAVGDGTGYSSIMKDKTKVANDFEANRLTEWFQWLLSASTQKQKRITVTLEMEISLADSRVKGHISRELAGDLLSACLKQELAYKVKLQLVKLVGDAYAETKTSKLAEKLCGFQVPGTTTRTNSSGQDGEVVQSPADLKSLESSLTEMKRTQQERILAAGDESIRGGVEEKGVADERGRGQSEQQQQRDGLQNGSQRRRWTLATNWQPCAIGMLPSSCYSGGVRPSWLLDCTKELCSSNGNEEEQTTATTVPDSRKKRKTCVGVDQVGIFTAVRQDEDDACTKLVTVSSTTAPNGGFYQERTSSQQVPPAETTVDDEHCDEEEAVESVKGCLLVNGKHQRARGELLAAIQREIRAL